MAVDYSDDPNPTRNRPLKISDWSSASTQAQEQSLEGWKNRISSATQLPKSHICLLKTFNNVWSLAKSTKVGRLKIGKWLCSRMRLTSKLSLMGGIEKCRENRQKTFRPCFKYTKEVPNLCYCMELHFCARNGRPWCRREKAQFKGIHRHLRGDTSTIHDSGDGNFSFQHGSAPCHTANILSQYLHQYYSLFILKIGYEIISWGRRWRENGFNSSIGHPILLIQILSNTPGLDWIQNCEEFSNRREIKLC